MKGCLLKVNDLPVTSLCIRPKGQTFDILITDPDFGEFPISRTCYLEYLDLNVPKAERDLDPLDGWKHVTYDELVKILTKLCVP